MFRFNDEKRWRHENDAIIIIRKNPSEDTEIRLVYDCLDDNYTSLIRLCWLSDIDNQTIASDESVSLASIEPNGVFFVKARRFSLKDKICVARTPFTHPRQLVFPGRFVHELDKLRIYPLIFHMEHFSERKSNYVLYCALKEGKIVSGDMLSIGLIIKLAPKFPELMNCLEDFNLRRRLEYKAYKKNPSEALHYCICVFPNIFREVVKIYPQVAKRVPQENRSLQWILLKNNIKAILYLKSPTRSMFRYVENRDFVLEVHRSDVRMILANAPLSFVKLVIRHAKRHVVEMMLECATLEMWHEIAHYAVFLDPSVFKYIIYQFEERITAELMEVCLFSLRNPGAHIPPFKDSRSKPSAKLIGKLCRAYPRIALHYRNENPQAVIEVIMHNPEQAGLYYFSEDMTPAFFMAMFYIERSNGLVQIAEEDMADSIANDEFATLHFEDLCRFRDRNIRMQKRNMIAKEFTWLWNVAEEIFA